MGKVTVWKNSSAEGDCSEVSGAAVADWESLALSAMPPANNPAIATMPAPIIPILLVSVGWLVVRPAGDVSALVPRRSLDFPSKQPPVTAVAGRATKPTIAAVDSRAARGSFDLIAISKCMNGRFKQSGLHCANNLPASKQYDRQDEGE